MVGAFVQWQATFRYLAHSTVLCIGLLCRCFFGQRVDHKAVLQRLSDCVHTNSIRRSSAPLRPGRYGGLLAPVRRCLFSLTDLTHSLSSSACPSFPSCRQLMLEPYAAPGNMAPPSVPPHMSRSSPLSSNLSTPTYSETNNTPNAGFHSSWPAPQTPDQGSDSRSGGVEGEGVQLWRPSIRFVWSPSCSGQPGIGSAGAGATGSVTPPHAGSAHPISIGSSVCSSISDSSADEQEGLGSSSGSSKGQVPEPVTKGVGCVTKQSERKLLPSSWSIRKKNSAPASYRAAYQAQCGKDESPAAAAAAGAELAPHAGSTAVTVPATAGIGARSLHGENALGLSSVGGSQDGASGSGWQLQCSGKLSVGPQVVDAAPAALSGEDHLLYCMLLQYSAQLRLGTYCSLALA